MISDKHSAAWIEIKEFTTEKLAELREQNDNPSLDDAETNVIRGQILFAKQILALEQAPEPRLEVASSSYID